MHRPQRPRRLWIRQSTFRSAYLSNIPQSVPSPSGRRSRPRRSTSFTDRKDRVDYGFGKAQSGRRTSQAFPNQSPLPPGAGADRGVVRHAPTAKTASIMDSAKHNQVGAPLKHPPIGSPLPPGEGADRGVARHAPTAKTASLMDSAKHFQVGVPLQHPPISPLSLREKEPTEA